MNVGVVVLDVLMPGMDGPATLRALREIQPGIPICYYTAVAGSYMVTDLLAAGASADLITPCPLNMLTATLRSLPQGDGASVVRTRLSGTTFDDIVTRA